jgi:glucose-6-phosphate isomerase
MTLRVNDVSSFTVGLLIALFERAVGLYASMININAYHQPGVEAGKKAASAILALQLKFCVRSRENSGKQMSVIEIAEAAGASDRVEAVFWICQHLSANPERNVDKSPAAGGIQAKYSYIPASVS